LLVRRYPVAAAGLIAIAVYPQTGDAEPARPADRIAVSLAVPERDDHAASIPMGWAEALPAIVVRNVNTGVEAPVRLYRADGSIDPHAVDEFALVAGRDAELHALSLRLVQLVFKSAYHFRATAIQVISGYRAQKNPKGGSRHASGEALDFRLESIKAPILAAHLRTYPRAGVGIYTHPKTQYVHLDVRDESFHWIDASPPGVSWRERGLPDPTRGKRDASYTPQLDLPFLTP
jgi:uncharacterized protein YcbK (DUF882 family)